jgi:hypothetical protein
MQEESQSLDIIQRTPCYTNSKMVEQCKLLLSIVDSTKEVKVKEGNKYVIEKKPKFPFEKEVADRIRRSYEYYKKLNEQDMERNDRVKFRDYQERIILDGARKINEHGFVYLAMEVRTGKTLTSLGIAEKINAKHVLFITKKKAISSIVDDFNLYKPSYQMEVVNYESLHTVMDNQNWDLIICDEAHSMGAFPKPSQRADLVKKLLQKCKPKVILLSGTPTPESYCQMYHQVYGIPGNPFSRFQNFYRFCDEHAVVKSKKIGGMYIKDYSNGRESILEQMRPHMINYTQAAAGFTSVITEEILEVPLKESTYRMINRLKKELVIQGKDEVILADTSVKLMMKLHQLYSGTIKFESGNSMIIDTTKAEFIKEQFEGCKIGIFYKFKEEYNALKQVFGDMLTDELSVFEDTNKNIALQIVSGREGVSLKKAEFLVYYNIDFSATSYWQSRDRMTTKDRTNNNVYWIFSKDGIEYDIYDAVTKKKDFTVSHFKNFIKEEQ